MTQLNSVDNKSQKTKDILLNIQIYAYLKHFVANNILSRKKFAGKILKHLAVHKMKRISGIAVQFVLILAAFFSSVAAKTEAGKKFVLSTKWTTSHDVCRTSIVFVCRQDILVSIRFLLKWKLQISVEVDLLHLISSVFFLFLVFTLMLTTLHERSHVYLTLHRRLYFQTD